MTGREIRVEHDGYVFESATQVHKVIVAAGEVVLVLVRGHEPERAELDAPGTYEVDLPWVKDASAFPITLIVVPEIEAQMITGNGKLSDEQRDYLNRKQAN